MYNIIATFNNLLNFKQAIKLLRKKSGVKGHMVIIHKDKSYPNEEKYISSVLMKSSKEISSLKLDDTVKGIIFGAIIGSLSSIGGILLSISFLHISTTTILAAFSIVFFGGAVGAIIGLLINNAVRKYDETNFSGEMTLILREIEGDIKDEVIATLKEFNPIKLKVY